MAKTTQNVESPELDNKSDLGDTVGTPTVQGVLLKKYRIKIGTITLKRGKDLVNYPQGETIDLNEDEALGLTDVVELV